MLGKGGFVRAMVRAPLLRATLPFVAGLVLALWLPLPVVACWLLVVVTFGLWLWSAFRKQDFGSRWRSGAWFGAFLLCFGLLWQVLHTGRGRPDHISALAGGAGAWEVEVTDVMAVKPRSIRAWAEAKAAVVEGRATPARGALLLTVLRDSSRAPFRAGDRLVVTGRMEPLCRVPDPGGFDVRQWAASHGAFHECFAPMEHWRLRKRSGVGVDVFAKARAKISAWLRASGLPERERALALAILLGQRDDMAHDQNQAFIRSGTIHVLAVSGTHVGIIYMAVLWGLVFLGKSSRGRLVRGGLALAALWAYAGLTGFQPSVLRATLMFSLFTLAEMVRWRTDSLNSLACAAALLLLWDPAMLGQLGFQLSFLAVLGISIFYRPIHQLWAPPNAVARFLWALVAVSLAAQAFTAPLCLYMFQAFPVWFLPANMAIVGLVGIGVYGGVLLLAVHAVPVLGALVTMLMRWLLLLLGFLSAFFGDLPGAYPAIRVGFWGMLGLYALLACCAIWWLDRRPWARMATMGCLAALLFGWGWTAHRRNARSGFVAYADREGLGCAFVQGRTLHVFAQDPGPRLQRSIAEHVRDIGACRVLQADSLPASVQFQGGRYIFQPVGLPMVDHADPGATIILYGKGWPQLPEAGPGPGNWVLAGGMDGGARAWMRKQAGANGVAVHDIRLAGAYVRP